MVQRPLSAAVALALAPFDAIAASRTVCASGCDFPQIQPALSASVDGDTVFVYPGMYSGGLTFGSDVALVGIAGSGATRVFAPGSGDMIRVPTGRTVTIRGFDLRVGVGSGVVADHANTTLIDLSVRGPVAGGASVVRVLGGVASLDGLRMEFVNLAGSPVLVSQGAVVTLTHLELRSTSGATAPSVGVEVQDSTVTVTDSLFERGTGAICGVAVRGTSDVAVSRTSITVCSGGGLGSTGGLTALDSVFVEQAMGGGARFDVGTTGATIRRSAFMGNSAGTLDGGAVYYDAPKQLVIEDSLFQANSAAAGGAVFERGAGGAVIERSRFLWNSGTSGSGAVRHVVGPLQLTGDGFAANATSSAGSGAVSGANSATTLAVSRSVFCRNTIGAGGGGVGALDGSLIPGQVAVRDSVFDGVAGAGVAPLIDVGGDDLTVGENLFWTGANGPVGALGRDIVPGPISVINNAVNAGAPGIAPFRVQAPARPLFVGNYNAWSNPVTGTPGFGNDEPIGANDRFAVASTPLPAAACELQQYRPPAGSAVFNGGANSPPWDSDIGPFKSAVDPTSRLEDLDGDGYIGIWDCDDAATAVNPGATEKCNGIDDDCDTRVDSLDTAGTKGGVVDAASWNPDDDGDGHGGQGSGNFSWCANDAPWPHWALDADDCDDADVRRVPGGKEVPYDGVDQDCSGKDLCDVDGDGSDAKACPGGGDCDDLNPAVRPAAIEVCNGVDDDCDGTADVGAQDAQPAYPDADGDGWGAIGSAQFMCAVPPGFAAESGDCVDTNASVNLNAPEVAYDGLDNDCKAATLDDDLDGDGYLHDGECDDADAFVNPGEVEVPYNGVDDDCAPTTKDDDLDGDGFALADDCDDDDPARNPAAPEIPNDAIDQDCDGADRCDLDGDGNPAPTCGGTDCDDLDKDVHPGGTEVVYDGLDNDCDATTKDDDLDGDEFALADDCDDANALRNPGATEVPGDGIDQDCDGADACDVDGDGDPAPTCGGTDCDDADAAVNPAADEEPYNGTDEDCDPATRDDDLDADGFALDLDCDDASASVHPDVVDVPYDGIDQDCDGTDACDVDGDGYDAASCGGDDCDDDDPSIHRGVPEVDGDGVDQNCEGHDRTFEVFGPGVECGCTNGRRTGSYALFGLIALALARGRRSRR